MGLRQRGGISWLPLLVEVTRNNANARALFIIAQLVVEKLMLTFIELCH